MRVRVARYHEQWSVVEVEVVNNEIVRLDPELPNMNEWLRELPTVMSEKGRVRFLDDPEKWSQHMQHMNYTRFSVSIMDD